MAEQLTLKALLSKHTPSGGVVKPSSKVGLEGALYKWGKAIEWRDARREHWEKTKNNQG